MNVLTCCDAGRLTRPDVGMQERDKSGEYGVDPPPSKTVLIGDLCKKDGENHNFIRDEHDWKAESPEDFIKKRRAAYKASV